MAGKTIVLQRGSALFKLCESIIDKHAKNLALHVSPQSSDPKAQAIHSIVDFCEAALSERIRSLQCEAAGQVPYRSSETLPELNTHVPPQPGTPVLRPWVCTLPLMQQSVLLTAIRGPDGIEKYSPVKYLLRWFRRCVLLSAMDKAELTEPYDFGEARGGSFTGPPLGVMVGGGKAEDYSFEFRKRGLDELLDKYIQMLDAVPHHFQLHFMHAAEILGYKYPDLLYRAWWLSCYHRLVNDMHLHPESEEEMDKRLGDNREEWLKRSDPATTN